MIAYSFCAARFEGEPPPFAHHGLWWNPCSLTPVPVVTIAPPPVPRKLLSLVVPVSLKFHFPMANAPSARTAFRPARPTPLRCATRKETNAHPGVSGPWFPIPAFPSPGSPAGFAANTVTRTPSNSNLRSAGSPNPLSMRAVVRAVGRALRPVPFRPLM